MHTLSHYATAFSELNWRAAFLLSIFHAKCIAYPAAHRTSGSMSQKGDGLPRNENATMGLQELRRMNRIQKQNSEATDKGTTEYRL